MSQQRTHFLRKMMSGILAVSLMLSSAVTAFAAKPAWNASVEEAGQRAAYVRIYLMDANGNMLKEVTPNNGEKIYTNDWLSYKVYRSSNDLLLKNYSIPLSYIYIKEGGSWVMAKDNLNNVGSQDLNVYADEGSRTKMYYIKPGHYKTTHHGYVDYAYGCEIEYDVLPGPRPVSPTGVSISPKNTAVYVGDTVNFVADVTPTNADPSVTWSVAPMSGSVHGSINASGTYTAKTAGTDEVTVTTSNGLTATTNITVNDCTSLTVDPSTVELHPGDSTTVTPTAAPAAYQDKITVSSGNANVTTSYNKNTGKITITAKDNAVTQAGLTTTVTVKAGSKSASVTVKVISDIPIVTDLLVSPESLNMPVGTTEKITAAHVPEAAQEPINFSSNNPDIASVDGSGNVTANTPGDTSIVVTCGSVSKTVPVTVTPITPTTPDLEKLAFDTDSLDMEVGDVEDCPARKVPADAKGDISYTSQNPDIATVDENGKVTAVREGETSITASCGDITAEIPVTVHPAPAPELTDLLLNPTGATIPVGETEQFTAIKVPAEAAGDVSFHVQDTEIALVDENGLVTANKPGETKLIASCGGITKEAAIIVPSDPSESDDPEKPGTTGLTVHPDDVTMKVGDKQPLDVKKEPADSKDPITFKTKDPSIAVVDPNGTITGIAEGETIVTVTSGSVTKDIPVKVEAKDPDGSAGDDSNGNGNDDDDKKPGDDTEDDNTGDKPGNDADGPGSDNGNARTGSLILRNTGVNAGKSKAFSYRFTFPDDIDGEYKMTGDVTGAVKDGTVITLYPGDEVEILGLPVGNSYSVEELDPGNRYSVRYKVDGGNSARGFKAKFAIVKDENTLVEFVNSKIGSSGSGSSSYYDHSSDPYYDGDGYPVRHPNENPGDRNLASSEANAYSPGKANPYTGR